MAIRDESEIDTATFGITSIFPACRWCGSVASWRLGMRVFSRFDPPEGDWRSNAPFNLEVHFAAFQVSINLGRRGVQSGCRTKIKRFPV